jgi:hypothetical protein
LKVAALDRRIPSTDLEEGLALAGTAPGHRASGPAAVPARAQSLRDEYRQRGDDRPLRTRADERNVYQAVGLRLAPARDPLDRWRQPMT